MNKLQEKIMNAEHCILVDKDDNIIGFDTKKNCHLITKGLKLHRAFSVFLFDKDNRLLLQKRSSDKITFPDYWANTCCSHPLHIEGETNGIEGVKNAARRKLEQELGIKPNQIPLDCLTFITRIHYKAICNDDIWGEHEIDYILICKPPENIILNINPNEVSQVKYFCQEELTQFMHNKELKSPWFNLIEEYFLYKWWNNLLNNKSNINTKYINKIYRL
jgi:isopentenyl-diphosphate Delta-isomerase